MSVGGTNNTFFLCVIIIQQFRVYEEIHIIQTILYDMKPFQEKPKSTNINIQIAPNKKFKKI